MARWQDKNLFTSLQEQAFLVEKKLRNNGIFIKNNVVYLVDKSKVGIKTYGKLDFLRNYCNHTIIDERSNKSSFCGTYL